MYNVYRQNVKKDLDKLDCDRIFPKFRVCSVDIMIFINFHMRWTQVGKSGRIFENTSQ